MDLGRKVTYSLWSNPNTRANTSTSTTEVSTPANTPAKIATAFFFSSSSCSYSGMARHTVAGVSRKLT